MGPAFRRQPAAATRLCSAAPGVGETKDPWTPGTTSYLSLAGPSRPELEGPQGKSPEVSAVMKGTFWGHGAWVCLLTLLPTRVSSSHFLNFSVPDIYLNSGAD